MHDYLQSSGNPSTVSFQLGSSKASPFSAVLAGMSGFDRPGASEAIKPMLMNVLGIRTESSVEVMNDADLLTSVLTKYPDCQNGVVLIAGTGSVAMSFKLNPESGNFVRIGRSGGWGHILGDEGSGFDIGRQGIRATLAAFEKARLAKNTGYEAVQQSPSCFHMAIMESLGVLKCWDPSLDLLSKIIQSDTGEFFDMKTRIAGVARVVLDHAASDLEAAEIASTSASHLVRLLKPLLRLDHTVEADSILVLSGGLMKCTTYRSILLGKLAAEKVYFRAVEFVEDPASAGVLSLISRKLL
jgi:N-acetylmuramic acid 6-phosphate etherase